MRTKKPTEKQIKAFKKNWLILRLCGAKAVLGDPRLQNNPYAPFAEDACESIDALLQQLRQAK